MALVRTTLSAAVAAGDSAITVASATGVAAGYQIRIDDEQMQVTKAYVSGATSVPVLRGQSGTSADAHVASASVVVGSAVDWANPEASAITTFPIAGRARTTTSYSAAGAISLPRAGTDVVAILNGTGALAMTLADPAKDNDGDMLYILGNGKAAHTVTYTAGLGDAGSGYTVGTFATGGQGCLSLVAANETWVPLSSPLAGTLTGIDISIA